MSSHPLRLLGIERRSDGRRPRNRNQRSRDQAAMELGESRQCRYVQSRAGPG